MRVPTGYRLRGAGVPPVRSHRKLLAVDDRGDLSLGQPDDALVEHDLVEVTVIDRLGAGGARPVAVDLPLLGGQGPGEEVGGLLIAAKPAR